MIFFFYCETNSFFFTFLMIDLLKAFYIFIGTILGYIQLFDHFITFFSGNVTKNSNSSIGDF